MNLKNNKVGIYPDTNMLFINMNINTLLHKSIGAIRVYQQMPKPRACAVLWVAEVLKTERDP